MSLLLTEAHTGNQGLNRLTADEFERLAEAGAFDRAARVELINGVLAKMSPIGPSHSFIVRRLDRLFHELLGRRGVVSVQMALRCGESSEPQPDLVIARGSEGMYADRHPVAGDALLVVEVADSSLWSDLTVKVPLYASVGVLEVWVVDLPHRQVHVFTDPRQRSYLTTAVLTSKDVLVPTAFPDVEIPINELELDRFP